MIVRTVAAKPEVTPIVIHTSLRSLPVDRRARANRSTASPRLSAEGSFDAQLRHLRGVHPHIADSSHRGLSGQMQLLSVSPSIQHLRSARDLLRRRNR